MDQPLTPIIMAVDDEALNRQFLKEVLEDDYQLHLFSSGEECLQQIEEVTPDLIVLDVELGGMDGYEVCRQLKLAPESHDIPIIFVSVHDHLQDRLNGYEAGGDDYVSKPFYDDELLAKIKHNLENKASSERLASLLSDATATAMTAMCDASKQGDIVQFLLNSVNCRSFEELACTIFSSTQALGLHCSLLIHIGSESDFFDDRGMNKPLEKELIYRCKDDGRILEYGNRAIINFEHVSLFVRNMPQDKCLNGELKDQLPRLIQGANSRVKAIVSEQLLKKQCGRIKQAIREIKEEFEQHESQAWSLMDDFNRDIRIRIEQLLMSEEQENQLYVMITSYMEALLKLYNSKQQMDTSFRELLEDLEEFNSPHYEDKTH